MAENEMIANNQQFQPGYASNNANLRPKQVEPNDYFWWAVINFALFGYFGILLFH